MADMKKFKIALPQKQLQKELSDILDSQISLIKAKQREIGFLTSLRDALLPKLMSGEIRVPIEEVTADV